MRNIIKNISFITILLITFSAISIAQSNSVLIPFRAGKLWGYSDTLGSIKIKPIYSNVSFFENGFGIIELNTKQGAINNNGQSLLPCKFDDVSYGKYDVVTKTYQFVVLLNSKFGLLNNKGQWLIKLVYDELKPLNKDRTKFEARMNGERYELTLDKKNIWHSKAINKFPIFGEDQTIAIKYSGDVVKKFWDKNTDSIITFLFNNYNLEMPIGYIKNSKWGLGDYDKMEFITAPKYKLITAVSANYFAYIDDNNNCGLVELTNTNNIIVPFIYNNIIEIYKDYVITEKDKLLGIAFITKQLKPINNKYSDINFFTSIPINANYAFMLFRVSNYKFYKIKESWAEDVVGQNGIEYFTDN